MSIGLLLLDSDVDMIARELAFLVAAGYAFARFRPISMQCTLRSPNDSTDNELFTVHNQIQEMDVIKSKIYQLETTHVAMKNK